MFAVRVSIVLLTVSCLSECKPNPKEKDNPRIIGGQDTEIEQHPHTVSVQYFGNHLCGGSIINSTWILTAGHCFGSSSNILLPFLSIRAGSSYHREGGTQHLAAKLIIHENFTSAYDNDIALIKLERPLSYGDQIQPIELPEQGDEVPPGLRATVVGWGHTDFGGELVEKLQEVNVFTIPRDLCSDIYGAEFTPSMMCAHDWNGGKDACNGDSGGPLASRGVQIGIVSAGATGLCGDANLPGVYTAVSQFANWIKLKTII